MKQSKSWQRELIEWTLLLIFPILLYITGLHTEAIGGIQRAFLAIGVAKPEKLPSDQQVPADYNLKLTTLEGRAINSDSFRGKVIFMNLWATWCPPCVAEMPSIQALYEQIDSNKIVFLMISLDEDIKKARKFLKRKQYTFPVYQLSGELPAVYSTASIPTTYIIAPNGQIVVRKEGMAKYDDERFVNLLNSLAKKEE